MSTYKRTKIICTIGPSSHTEETLLALMEAGMDVCRLNFSHGTHEDHAMLINLIRKAAKTFGRPIAILQDLQGPKIRVGELPEAGVELEDGTEIIFTTGVSEIPRKLPVTYLKLHEDVKSGERLLLVDGLMSARVTKVEGQDVTCTVEHGGTLFSHKGINLPDTHVSASALSEKDRIDMQFGVEQGVDWMALSFVRRAEDVRELRRLIIQEEEKIGSQSAPILIMTKIEKPEAIEYFDEILAETDGIMVARGDLGVEIAPEKVPVLQKEMIEKCLLAAKPVVVATQMFESMIHEPHPTRAEVSDVANAVIDHTDATMLSGETAIGHFPVEAVAMMSATICETEESRFDDLPIQIEKERMQNQAMTNIASALVQARSAKAILVATLSGHAARLVSRYRPEVPIFAVTPHERVVRQLNASWGVHGILIPTCATLAELLDQSVGALKRLGVVQSGDDLIVVAGEPLGTSGHVNLVEWWKV